MVYFNLMVGMILPSEIILNSTGAHRGTNGMRSFSERDVGVGFIGRAYQSRR